MTTWQHATNAAALRNLADTLERWGLSDPHDRAQHIANTLLADGYRRTAPPIPTTGSNATPAARAAALAACAEAVRAAKDKTPTIT